MESIGFSHFLLAAVDYGTVPGTVFFGIMDYHTVRTDGHCWALLL